MANAASRRACSTHARLACRADRVLVDLAVGVGVDAVAGVERLVAEPGRGILRLQCRRAGEQRAIALRLAGADRGREVVEADVALRGVGPGAALSRRRLDVGEV